PAGFEQTIEGQQVYMVHAEPPAACHGGIKLRDRSGEVQADRVMHWEGELADFRPDVLIVGHTHQVYAEQVGDTLVVNPGSSAFNYSCAILHLPSMTVETYPLAGQPIKPVWNWSDHFGKS
ncbi:MAG: metallophosphoesterase family protein, partial [Gammaproteobacteria bacterium]|nr:metallophosphoesterase family protein [Gammaproteobacteria bacterium]